MRQQPYGRWDSPITAELLVEDAADIREVVSDGDLIWWAELRPSEKGRTAVCCRKPDGSISEITPAGANVSNHIHSYGGAAWWAAEGVLYYQDANSKCLHMLRPDGEEAILASPDSGLGAPQYGDGRATPDGKWFICIRESYPKNKSEPVNDIVAIPTSASQKISVLAKGADFYSSPRISPDGKKLAWIQWDHPNMSWDGTELWAGQISFSKIEGGLEKGLEGELKAELKAEYIAGGPTEWIFQPEWKSPEELSYVSDDNGWSVLYIHDFAQKHSSSKNNRPPSTKEPVLSLEAEIAVPEWVLGESRYCFLANGDMAYAMTANAQTTLKIQPAQKIQLVSNRQLVSNKQAQTQEQDAYSSYRQVRKHKDGIVALVASWDLEPHIVYIKNGYIKNAHIKNGQQKPEVIYSGKGRQLDPEFFLAPEAIQFPTAESETAFGLYYPPANPTQNPANPNQNPANPKSSQDEASKPPLIVTAHGGPTAAARTFLYLGHRFWTSRGFAVLDVDYRGSSGYGRKYREALNGGWGKADIEDCVAGAKYLVDRGEVNPNQIAIRGSSAGGLTVLLALALHDVFSCGAVRYGVVDLEALSRTTHKFESRYLDRLIGDPKKDKDRYRERSPITHIDKFHTPMILMSGTEDPVVPAEQSQKLAVALEAKGVSHELLMFEGEGHGFRQSENIIAALKAELDFFRDIFRI